MARSINSATQTQINTGRIARTEMVLFDFPSPTGQKGFFSGQGELQWSGITFYGAGTLFEISTIGGAADGSAVPLAIKLNGDVRSGLTATVLAQIESVQYRNAPVTIYRRYMHPETYAELSTEAVYRGRIDTIKHKISEGGECSLEVAVESRMIDFSRSGHRMRTDADQRLIDANDGSLSHVQTTAEQKIEWGKIPTKQKRKKLFGIF